MIERDDIKEAISDALREFHKSHSDLISLDVREEALTFHLAGYLIPLLGIQDSDLCLDVEYNKNREGPKGAEVPDNVAQTIDDELEDMEFDPEEFDPGTLERDQGAGFRPDIVLHERGHHDRNVFVAEVKKLDSDIHAEDVGKVLFLTHPDAPNSEFDYSYGAVIPLNSSFLAEEGFYWFEEGRFDNKIQVDDLPAVDEE